MGPHLIGIHQKVGTFALNPHRVAACALGWGNKFPQVSKSVHTLSPLGKAWDEQYSAACVTLTVQQEIEKILLLAIADIEKVQKYYSNDWIFLILN
ncbi:hypothetical protein [Nostoc sp.]|uniref:hypothetical protein n=1 Tax=Nostoc sp. TaxID=1180 RepID=UPI002FF7CB69